VPQIVVADAAYDAWHVYQWMWERGGQAIIPLNTHGHPLPQRDADGVPRCERGHRMHPSQSFRHTNGYQARRFVCPLLAPTPTGATCSHEQFAKGKGCVKDLNWEVGGRERVLLDRTTPLAKGAYKERTCAERIFSQAKEKGLARPKLRNGTSIARRTTLIYLTINAGALQRARETNRSLLEMRA
jgi:hypothetical protein